jgi:hypothetical protein
MRVDVRKSFWLVQKPLPDGSLSSRFEVFQSCKWPVRDDVVGLRTIGKKEDVSVVGVFGQS